MRRSAILLGQARDEVEVRLIELIGAGHLDLHWTHGLPVVTRGNVGHDPRQRHVFPAAATGGLAAAAHVAGLTSDHQRIRWAGQFDFVDDVAADAGQ
jgi:hypothetical protein